MAHKEGNIITADIKNNGGSLYLLISPDIAEYLGVTEKDSLAIKFEKSKKYGNYIGVGLDKTKK